MNDGTPLEQKEYSHVCREMARPIEEHTLRAHPDHYAEQVATLLKRYPKVTIKEGELKDTAVSEIKWTLMENIDSFSFEFFFLFFRIF